MTNPRFAARGACVAVCLAVALGTAAAHAQDSWEITPESRQALEQGLEWLARSQGPEGNWNTQDLGLVSMGMLAFLSDGHAPGRGKYGVVVQKALNHVLSKTRPSGLINIAGDGRDMYNHGLSTFVLGQAYGMAGDARTRGALERALKIIVHCQGGDGGWDYVARPGSHDLSLAVMQAKALRGAMDSGFDVPPSVVRAAVGYVRRNYGPIGCTRNEPEAVQKTFPGRFSYQGDAAGGTVAMAAAGVVCMQEFAQYDDWRIGKNIAFIEEKIRDVAKAAPNRYPFEGTAHDAYTLYYVAQALYQVGGEPWKRSYPPLRDRLITSQIRTRGAQEGGWGNDLYKTSVACFVLAIPNRYLPILQEGKIDAVRKSLESKPEAGKGG